MFSIENADSRGGGHDRHIYLKGGKIHHRVWPGGTFVVSHTNYADGNWHTLKLTSEKGQPITTVVDGQRLRDYKKVDQSNFDWASEIHLGHSKDMNHKNLVGSLRNVYYRSTEGSSSIKQNNGVYIRHRNW